MKYDWKLLKYPEEKEAIKGFLDQVIQNNPNLPANNRWQFLFPILDRFFKNNWCVFATLIDDEKAVCAVPITESHQKKFMMKWTEVGFPRHSHINYIEINVDDIETALEDLALCISTCREKWHRLCLRNVNNPDLANREYTGDFAWFNTTGISSINEIVSKKHIRNTKRLKNRLEDQHSTPVLTTSQSNTLNDLNDFIRVEESSWKGQAGLAISNDLNLLNLYKDIATSFSKDEFLIYKLIIGNTIVSAALGFHLGKTLYLHKVSFDPNYANYAPGNILLLELINKAIEDENIDAINLINKPVWSKRWHPKTDGLGNFTFYNQRITSRILRRSIDYWRIFKKWAKKLKIQQLRYRLMKSIS